MRNPVLYTTLNAIRAHGPCESGWTRLLEYLGKTKADDEPLQFLTILESNGLDDALWCCRAAPEHANMWRLFTVWCARQVQHLMTDPRSIAALDVAERHENVNATDSELAAAWAAARAARAAMAAAMDAAMDAVWAAARAARAAMAADMDAAEDAAEDAAMDAQSKQFSIMIGGDNA